MTRTRVWTAARGRLATYQICPLSRWYYSLGLTDITVPLVSRRRERVQLAQKIQHGVPAIVIFFEGLDRILSGAGDVNRWLGTVEAFASLLVLGAIARAIGRLRWGAGHTPPRQRVHLHQVDWVDVLLAAMLFTEVAAHKYETGGWRRPTLLLAILTLGVGLMHGRLTAFQARRRALRVTDQGVTVGGRFFSRFIAPWAEISRIDIAEKQAAIVMKDGRVKAFDLIDLRHGNDVTRALARARVRLEAATGAPPPAVGQPQTS